MLNKQLAKSKMTSMHPDQTETSEISPDEARIVQPTEKGSYQSRPEFTKSDVTNPSVSIQPNRPTKLYTIIAILIVGLLVTGSALANVLMNQSRKIVDATQTALPSSTIPSSSTVTGMEGGVSDWQTYTNLVHNYSVKYPSDWEFFDSCLTCSNEAAIHKGEIILKSPDLEYNAYPHVTKGGYIYVDGSTPDNTYGLGGIGRTPYEFCTSSDTIITSCEEVIVAGKTAYKAEYQLYNFYDVTVFEDGIGILTLRPYYTEESKSSVLNVFDQILSTFEFVGISQSNSLQETQLNNTSKTCRQDNLGISIDVPNEFLCESTNQSQNLSIKSILFTLTISNTGDGPYCVPNCNEETYYQNPSTATLSKKISDGSVLGIWGTTTKGPWIDIKVHNSSDFALSEEDESILISILDSIK